MLDGRGFDKLLELFRASVSLVSSSVTLFRKIAFPQTLGESSFIFLTV
jgi:hypothetical protein